MFLRSLSVSYPVLPPSSNKIFAKFGVLTGVAREYAEDFAKYMAQHHLHQINQMNQAGIFAIHLRFFFQTVVNETWNNPAVKPSKRAKERYKRFDLDNRVKLLQDCIRDAIDVDDSHVFAASQEKHQDFARPRVEIHVQEVEPSMFGV
jgi:Holliday junction resolvase RusA-like endonuclease